MTPSPLDVPQKKPVPKQRRGSRGGKGKPTCRREGCKRQRPDDRRYCSGACCTVAMLVDKAERLCRTARQHGGGAASGVDVRELWTAAADLNDTLTRVQVMVDEAVTGSTTPHGGLPSGPGPRPARNAPQPSVET
ncbi:hypothetical protein MMOR_52460 [Mycolicibacterium moriokaense]|uniref:Uncharacterized protein n=1 Tax=Mycolicibacterium moriokaense TaxID=39691 RepID=A0AAD1HGE4_9MYCO|nr:hypothetical protein MMOR_52460 [Mycolicibacterium moriokaense]